MELLRRYDTVLPLQVIGHMAKSDVCSMMRASDGLLLLNPQSLSCYIPGKTYDYVASGRPILLYGEGGEMAAIVGERKAGVVVPAGDP